MRYRMPTRRAARTSTGGARRRWARRARGRPRPAHTTPRRFLGDDERFADAPELGFLGPILDQDTATVARVQRGLRASVYNETTLARYQEVRIRHFHAVLGEYLGA